MKKASALDFNGAIHVRWSYLYPPFSAAEWLRLPSSAAGAGVGSNFQSAAYLNYRFLPTEYMHAAGAGKLFGFTVLYVCLG